MATPKESLLDWLRDTHAMEQQAEKMLYEANASGRLMVPVHSFIPVASCRA
jgi:hypothetical protein